MNSAHASGANCQIKHERRVKLSMSDAFLRSVLKKAANFQPALLVGSLKEEAFFRETTSKIKILIGLFFRN